MKRRFFSLYLILILFSLSLSAQNAGNIWYFGSNAGVDFNTGSPVALTNGAINTSEGCAVISDVNGNLLFYTDGSTAYNRNHVVMTNGNGLLGHSSSTQSGIIVPNPGNINEYYLWTAGVSGGGDIRYSVVDMSLSGGLGAVTAVKNVLMMSPCSEKLTACKHANGTDYWVLSHRHNTADFYAWRVRPTGIDPPIITNVGVVHSSYIGYMKVAPNGSSIALCMNGAFTAEVLDFDNATGVPSNPRFSGNMFQQVYGIEFSPNSQLFYLTDPGRNEIWQFDPQSANPWGTGQVISGPPGGGNFWAAMQLGPDRKIYMSQSGSGNLHVINDPDVVGVGCNFQMNVVPLGGRTCRLGLPTFNQSIFNVNVDFTFVGLCDGDTTFFTIQDTSGLDSVFWNFGDPPSGILNASTDLFPYHIYPGPGSYSVELIAWDNGVSDTVVHAVNMNAQPTVFLGNDTMVCAAYTLDATFPGATYLWSDNSTNATLNVAAPGMYWVEVSIGNCIARDTVNVTFAPAMAPFDLGNDTTLCTGETLLLDVTQPNVTYLWSDNSTNSTLLVSAAGQYWVEVTDACQSVRDTININYIVPPAPNLGNDTTACAAFTLDATTPGASYLWSDNSTNATLQVFTDGLYFVEVTLGTCIGRDTIDVTFAPALQPFNLGNDTVLCTNASLSLDVSQANATDYLWQDGSINPNFTITGPGMYWVEVSDSCGGIRDTIEVTYLAPPTVDLGNDTIMCTGTSITLDADPNGLHPGSTYAWGPGGQTSQTITVNAPRVYSVTVSNFCGIAIDAINIVEETLPALSLGNDQLICPGDQVVLTGDPFGVNAGSTYLWSTGATTETITVSSVDATYSVSVSNVCGTVSDDVTFTVEGLPVVDLGPDLEQCEGPPIRLNAANQFAHSYLWSDGSTSPLFDVTQSGTYSVELTGLCATVSDVIRVDIWDNPVPVIPADTLICEDQVVDLSTTIDYAAYDWSTGESTPMIQVIKASTYIVTVTDDHGCRGWTEMELFTEPCPIAVYVPNIFSPNGDELNDFFFPVPYEVTVTFFAIYDRWGKLIHKGNSDQDYWDGNFGGKTAPEGNYVWVIRYVDQFNETGEMAGSVILAR